MPSRLAKSSMSIIILRLPKSRPSWSTAESIVSGDIEWLMGQMRDKVEGGSLTTLSRKFEREMMMSLRNDCLWKVLYSHYLYAEDKEQVYRHKHCLISVCGCWWYRMWREYITNQEWLHLLRWLKSVKGGWVIMHRTAAVTFREIPSTAWHCCMELNVVEPSLRVAKSIPFLQVFTVRCSLCESKQSNFSSYPKSGGWNETSSHSKLISRY